MNQKSYLRLMLALTLIFGASIAVLALLQVGDIGIVAAVGGIILGLGWALAGTVAGRRNRAS
ncbi:hypothetical protein [Nonomuraea zeae]|uniref:Uncharacterized protein n=1 Tax=Nonomuraea zeae TaxID=1642303 RepID=A0A5S4FL64_9ACTN|nr:hypothetical protein [Nonomuraea zeae]TMR21468.1 hypothetical protein ETD85_50840 [Nonomuraea zeae]